MEEAAGSPRGVRDRMRETIRQELSEATVRLIEESGFANTTVAAIARSVGVSERTFFRYFATKEDAVLRPVESLGPRLAEALRQRPAEEAPLESLRRAFDVAVDAVVAAPEAIATAVRLNRAEPALRRRHLQEQDAWIAALADASRDRRPGHSAAVPARLHAGIVVLAWEEALLACFDAGDFGRIGERLDAAIQEVRDFGSS